MHSVIFRGTLTKWKSIFDICEMAYSRKTNGAVTIFLQEAKSNDTGVTVCTIHGRQCTPLKSFQHGVYHCSATVSNLYLARDHRGNRFWYHTTTDSCTVAWPAFIFRRYRGTNISLGQGYWISLYTRVSLQVYCVKFKPHLVNWNLIFPRLFPEVNSFFHPTLANPCWFFHLRHEKSTSRSGNPHTKLAELLNSEHSI